LYTKRFQFSSVEFRHSVHAFKQHSVCTGNVLTKFGCSRVSQDKWWCRLCHIGVV